MSTACGLLPLQSMDHDYQVTGLIIGCAIEVHKELGPGLKENSYVNALCEALSCHNIRYQREPTVRVRFGESRLESSELIYL